MIYPFDERGRLKTLTIIVLLSMFLFRSVNIYLIYLVAPMLGAWILTKLYSFVV